MSGLFGGANKSTVKPAYTGLELQTSVSTLPVPIIWGQTKAAANVVWYANFKTHAVSSSSGGKGGGSSTTGYTYSADVILALCEGPISGIGQIWKDQSTYTLSGLGLSFFNGATPQATWGYIAGADPADALGYQGTAYVCAASYNLGDDASLGNHNFEIIGLLAGTGVNGVDADPAQVINDFLTNPQYGAGFSAVSIDATTLFGASGDSSLQSYCRALGIAFSPALVDQEQGSSILARWLQLVNCAAVWSGARLKFIPYADAAIHAGASTTTTTGAVVPTPSPVGAGSSPPPSIAVCGQAEFVGDGGVVYAETGRSMTRLNGGDGGFAEAGSWGNWGGGDFSLWGAWGDSAVTPTEAGTYSISPAGTYLFAAGDEGAAIEITYTSAPGASFVPDLTPVYDLTDLDFVDEKGNTDPVQAARVDPFSLPTIQRLECLSRDNEYATIPVEARDQSQIELYGPRVGTTIQAHEICDEIGVGAIVAQTILQRQLYVRAHFTFKLSWEYCLLDPMDVVTITDANLGLASYPVRIVAIEEDDKGLLTVAAEELTVGVSTPALYPNASTTSSVPNRGATPDLVNTPLIWEPPPALSGGTPQLWLAASGGSGGVADANWGGAFVWASLDGVSYSQIATIAQPVRQGFLTAALPAAVGWDATDTLSVNLAGSAGALSGTSLASAQQGATRSLVDNELLSYESATLAGTNAYNLTGLQRGMSGTNAAAHASGAPFARIDAAVVAVDLPANYIGATIYLKFQGFNIFGAGLQSLADCAAYPYAVSGSGASDPVAQQLLAGQPTDLGSVAAAGSVADDFGAVAGVALTDIDLGTA
jgi:hypothetical protein